MQGDYSRCLLVGSSSSFSVQLGFTLSQTSPSSLLLENKLFFSHLEAPWVS